MRYEEAVGIVRSTKFEDFLGWLAHFEDMDRYVAYFDRGMYSPLSVFFQDHLNLDYVKVTSGVVQGLIGSSTEPSAVFKVALTQPFEAYDFLCRGQDHVVANIDEAAKLAEMIYY